MVGQCCFVPVSITARRLLDFIYGAGVKQQCSIALCSFWRHSTQFLWWGPKKSRQTVIVPSFRFLYLNTGEFVYDAENSGARFDGLRGGGCKWTWDFFFWKVKSCFKYTSFGFSYFFCDLNCNLNIFCTMLHVFSLLNLLLGFLWTSLLTTWAGSSFPVACVQSTSLAATVCSRTWRLKNGAVPWRGWILNISWAK